MKILDPGHRYLLTSLDGGKPQELRFVKRCEPPEKYPGNTDAYPGTTTQEVCRALIERTVYVDGQIPDPANREVVEHLRAVILLLEERAARRHGRVLNPERLPRAIELLPTCAYCGHVRCACVVPAPPPPTDLPGALAGPADGEETE